MAGSRSVLNAPAQNTLSDVKVNRLIAEPQRLTLGDPGHYHLVILAFAGRRPES